MENHTGEWSEVSPEIDRRRDGGGENPNGGRSNVF
jgi:hypothetical protein